MHGQRRALRPPRQANRHAAAEESDAAVANTARNTHDSALLELLTPSSFSPIRLAVANSTDDQLELPPTVLTVIGWGTTTTGKPRYPNELREVDVPAVNDATCGGAYGASLDAATMVCAGAPNIDSCYGDSGGPLFFRNNGAPVQVGIVSWGNGCAKRKFPGVYSEVDESGDPFLDHPENRRLIRLPRRGHVLRASRRLRWR